LFGAVQETSSVVDPAVLAGADGVGDDAEGAAGVAGTVVTVTALEASDARDVPAALLAVTVNVGVALDAIPVTIIGEAEPVPVCPVLAVTV
jgi:hypothetical protein